MKIIPKPILAILLLFALTANAQTKPFAHTMLWEVSGKGIAKPSYLFGTMHMMCEKDFIISEPAKKAFDQSQKLVLELDMDDTTELENMQKMTLSEQPLSETLTATEYQKLDDFLKKQIGVGVAPLENYSLIAIMSLVMIKALNCPPKVYELEFSQMAAQKNIEVLGLEKASEQVTALTNSYTNAEMIEQLQHYDATYMDQLVKVYLSQNLTELYAMVVDERFMDTAARSLMLDSRNQNWVKLMPELMQNQSTFFAVGAGHLVGENGLITLLTKAGYTVKPVMK